MGAFRPIGLQARWRTIYEMLRGTPTDTVITYDELGEALGLHPDDDRHAIQMAMRRAATELEHEDLRAVDVEANKGYRIVQAPERLGLARKQGKKATRALARGYSKAAHVDLSEVNDPVTRRALELTAQAFAMQMDFNKRFAVRQEQLEKAVQGISEVQAADRRQASAEVTELRAELARLQARVDGL